MRTRRSWSVAALLLIAGLALYVLVKPVSAPESEAPGPPPDLAVPERVTPIETVEPGERLAVDESPLEPVADRPPPAAPEPFKATIQGSVSDALTREPLEEFQLLVKTGRFINYNPRKHRGFQTVRSPDGLFFINDIPARGVTKFVRTANYEPQFRYVAGLEVDTASTDVDFLLVPRASLVLTVTDRMGTPLENIEVHLSGAQSAFESSVGSFEKTNEEGIAQLAQVPAGHQALTLIGSKQNYQETEINILAGEENHISLVFNPLIPLSGTIHFRRNAHLSVPIPEAVMSCNLGNRTFTSVSDDNGKFKFESVPSGKFPLYITLPIDEIPLRAVRNAHFIEKLGIEFFYDLPSGVERRNTKIEIPALTNYIDLQYIRLEFGDFRGTAEIVGRSFTGLSTRVAVPLDLKEPLLFTPLPYGDYRFVLEYDYARLPNGKTVKGITSRRLSEGDEGYTVFRGFRGGITIGPPTIEPLDGPSIRISRNAIQPDWK